MIRSVLRLPAALLLRLLGFYHRGVSPALPAFFGPGYGCRFVPSCSDYAEEAIRTRGAAVGLGLALLRLAKCTPFHPGGLDPVPAPRRHSLPRCVRVAG